MGDSEFEIISAKERAFALAYVISYNLAQACKEVGISQNKGKQWLREPRVLSFVVDLQNEKAQYDIMTEDYIKTVMMDLLNKLRGVEEMIVGYDDEGEPIYQARFYPQESVALAKEMAKMTTAYNKGSNPAQVAITSLAELFKDSFDE